MTDMIKELWYGNIIPQEDGIFNKPELRELLGYVVRHRGDLEETLTDKQKELLDKQQNRSRSRGFDCYSTVACVAAFLFLFVNKL